MTPGIPELVHTTVKLLMVVGLTLYSLFAVIVVRQERLMAGVLEESFEPVLRILTMFHLIASIGVVLLAIVLL